jgi:hypothetical protein
MHAGAVGTLHTTAFIKELSLWVQGHQCKDLTIIIILHLSTTEFPWAITGFLLLPGSSKNLLCDAMGQMKKWSQEFCSLSSSRKSNE